MSDQVTDQMTDQVSQEVLIKELLSELNDDSLVDSKALFIVRTIYKYDQQLGMEKAIEMRNSGRNKLAINAFLLGVQSKDDSNSMEMIDLDEY